MDLSRITLSTKRYVDSFRFLVEAYDEILSNTQARENLQKHVSFLKEKYALLMNKLPAEMYEKIINRKTRLKSFRDVVSEQAEHKREKHQALDNTVNRVGAIGEKIVFVNMKDILPLEDQVRKEYNQDSINALAREMGDYGQLKPGLLLELVVDGQKKYKIIYGHTRYIAAKKIDLQYYKAFTRTDLGELDRSILQAIEDLSENDTPMEHPKSSK